MLKLNSSDAPIKIERVEKPEIDSSDGDFADLLIEEKVIVELKTVKTLLPEHEAQIINYLNATQIEVGLLINFGVPRIETKRFTRSFDYLPK